MAHSTSVKWLNPTNVQYYLDKFAEEFYKRYQGKVALSISIYGGSALLLKHPNFRVGTVDIDAYIRTTPDIQLGPFIREFSLAYNIPYDWMNEDLCKSKSFSIRLVPRTFVYKVLYNCVELRFVADSDQLCMKVIAGRSKDRDDVRGLTKALKESGFTADDFVSTLHIIYGPQALELVNKWCYNYVIKNLSRRW